jgi:hypothetical protein
MDKPAFNQRSCTSPCTSDRREATLVVRGFTAGGSGTVSTEAIASNSPRTQIMPDLDFIPASPSINDNRISAFYFCAEEKTVPQRKAAVEWARHYYGCPCFVDHCRKAEFDDFWTCGRQTGNYLPSRNIFGPENTSSTHLRE